MPQDILGGLQPLVSFSPLRYFFFTPFLFLALDFDEKRLVSGLAFARYIQPR